MQRQVAVLVARFRQHGVVDECILQRNIPLVNTMGIVQGSKIWTQMDLVCTYIYTPFGITPGRILATENVTKCQQPITAVICPCLTGSEFTDSQAKAITTRHCSR